MSAAVDFLIAAHPLLRFVRGEKKDFLRRAWIAAALEQAGIAMNKDIAALPTSPRAALLALHRAVLELGVAAGVERMEFVQHFNDHGEAGGTACTPDEAIEAARGLFLTLLARKLEQAA